MNRSGWLYPLAALVVATTVFFTNLGGARLFDDDEGKNSTCGREMFARGDWIVPTFNHDLRTDKPVLIYWFMMTAYGAFGISEFSARFWSAAWGVGTVLLTYALGRRLFQPSVGFWSGLALATCVMFDVAARAATPDSTLIFFATLAIWLFVRCIPNALPGKGIDDRPDEPAPVLTGARWFHFVPTYAAMGCAVLAKGPVGVVLPTSALVLYVLLHSYRPRRDDEPAAGWRERVVRTLRNLATLLAPRAVAHAIWAMRPLVALATVGAVALPWYVAVGVQTQGAWLAGFLGKHNLERFLEPMEGHRGPIVYYVAAVIVGFFPWSIFLPLSLIEVRQKLHRRSSSFSPYLLLSCWAGFYIGFFSLAGTKLPSYVLPAYPALAIITGAWINAWLREPARYRGFKLRAALGSLPVVGVGMVIALPIIARFVLPGEGWLGLLGLILVAGGGYAYWQAEAGRTSRAAAAVAIAAAAFATGLFGFAAPYVSGFQNTWPVVEAAQRHAGGDARLATFDYFQPSLVYYAADRVERLASADDAAAVLAADPDAYLVTRDVHLDELLDRLPPGVAVLSRQRRFLRSGEVVLLGRAAQTARQQAPPGEGPK